MKNKRTIGYRIFLIFIIIVVVNILSDRFFLRLDFTEDNQYTLSNATKEIIEQLDEPVTVTAYFTGDLPANLMKTRRDFKDLLTEYNNVSRGKVVYEFINPSENRDTEQKAIRDGIRPVIVNVREKDQMKQQKVYLGAIVQKGSKMDVIPYINPGAAMEYALSSSIKKLTIKSKPLVGYITGHGERSLSEFSQVLEGLRILYDVEEVNLDDTAINLSDYQTIVFISPKDSIPSYQLDMLDDYLAGGGNMFVGYDKVKGDFQNARAQSVNTGMDNWLSSKGIIVENNLVIDANCGSIGVRQQQGGFSYTTNINFPYFPIITNFEEHPITEGLESVTMPFVSSINFTGDTSLSFIPIAKSSKQSGTQTPPVYFNVNKRWAKNDFPLSHLVVGGILSGNIEGSQLSKIVVFGDGEFPVSGQGQQQVKLESDNVNLMVNSIDWLADETGLIQLRTKGITSRPIEHLEDGTKTWLKWLNFLVPITLIIVYGIIRMQRNRNKRIKRMEEGYV